MSALEWEVRNSASLTFTALVVRTVGFKNVLKVCPARHAPPSSEDTAVMPALFDGP